MKQFIGTCVNNPFHTIDKLNSIIDKSIPITRGCFLNRCEVPEKVKREMYQFPNDFEYRHSTNGIAFYIWSAIEHFYK